MADVVLDASAILALIRNEPGAEAVAEIIETAIVASVNAAEVVGKLIRDGVEASDAIHRVRILPCPIAAVDEALGYRAGELVAAMRRKGLSLGDCVCLALAERETGVAVTADRAWADAGVGVEIILIR